ncbi:hypothetical protein Ciccas_000752 [Cichlidogyrus casuarinus]|uniref:Uncharacterized protein n=1 Tax=Cichlidogyrus casuarinus TaxID=1844966 RepID=A0ABD2QQ08_9PLAT
MDENLSTPETPLDTDKEHNLLVKAQTCQMDSQWAGDFIMELMRLVPILFHQTSNFCDIDNLLIEFCSTYCDRLLKARMEQDITSRNEWRESRGYRLKNLILFKEIVNTCSLEDTWQIYNDFVAMLHPSGILVYLPDTWLAVLYKSVREQNLLHLIGGLNLPNSAALEPLMKNNFIRLLMDCTSKSCHEARESNKMGLSNGPRDFAGRLIIKSFLDQCWEQMLTCLSGVVSQITKNRGCGFIKSPLAHLINWTPALVSARRQIECEVPAIGTEKRPSVAEPTTLKSHQYLVQLLTGQASREEQRRLGMVLCVGLLSLRRAAKLTSTLGLQSRCSSVFSLLVNACIVSSASVTSTNFWSNLTSAVSEEDGNSQSISHSMRASDRLDSLRRMHLSEVLSLQTVLSGALEMGVHAPECWDDVFRACRHIAWLEHIQFLAGNTKNSVPQTGEPVVIPNFE